MLRPSASGYYMQRHSGQLSAQARTKTTGAHTHVYRQHLTQLQQPKKVNVRPIGHTLVKIKPLAEVSAFMISITWRSAQHAIQLRGQACTVCFKTQRSLGSSSLSLAIKRVSRSTAACQHQTCIFAWQQPLMISRTGLIINRHGQQNK